VNPYTVLGLNEADATDETIKTAFRSLAKEHHGDADPTRFTEIKDAYDKINTEAKRNALRQPRSFSFHFGGNGPQGFASGDVDIDEVLRNMMNSQGFPSSPAAQERRSDDPCSNRYGRSL
jgi:DnaJ-class molecular chaperone